MSKKHLRFAVIMDIVFSPFQEKPKNGISCYLKEQNLDAVFFGIGSLFLENAEDVEKLELLEFITPEEYDGILIVSASFAQNKGLEVLKRKLMSMPQVPVVSIGPKLINEPNILYDSRTGMIELMNHLIIEHGYKRYAYVGGPSSSSEAQVRLEVFRSALDEAGIEHTEEDEYEGNFISLSGEAAVREFLDIRKVSPEVIVCANDGMAVGVWKELIRRGLNIPSDIAVTGFDDERYTNTLSTQFTTAQQSFYVMGYQAAELLHSYIISKKKPRDIILSPQLQIRISCGCIRTEDRYDSGKKGVPPNTKLKNLLSEWRTSNWSTQKEIEILSEWTKAIRTRLSQKKPAYDLEEFITSDLGSSNSDVNDKEQQMRSALYTLLREEYDHEMVAGRWDDLFFEMSARMAMDQVQEVMLYDQSEEKKIEAFTQLARSCSAEHLHCFQFNDPENIKAGAAPLYTSVKPNGWEAVPGSWIPREHGSMALNLLMNGDQKFGYFLIDADLPLLTLYDYLRTRFNSILREHRSLMNIRRINTELKEEISQRIDTEKQLTEAITLVQQLSIKDELTGLLNRRGFTTLASQQIRYLRRKKQQFLIVFGDLNSLKEINDKYGHKEGDKAIKAISRILEKSTRESDIIGRIGGDEFNLLINESDEEFIPALSKRIETLCDSYNRETDNPWELAITIGYFFSPPNSTTSLEEMLEMADEDLYRRKKGGGKQIL